MLLQFSFQNFRSFKDAVTLDLVSSTKVQSLPDHVVRFRDMKVLKGAVVYGANASGKSNLFKALALVREVLVRGKLPASVGSSYCKIGEGGKTTDTIFDVMFEVDGEFFDYGFSARLAELRVTSEWLYSLSLGEGRRWKQTVLFEREEGSEARLGPEVRTDEDERMRFELYAADFAPISNALFLSELNRGKHYEKSSSLFSFTRAYRYLVDKIHVIGADEHRLSTNIYLEQFDQLPRISRLISGFDTGVVSISPVSISPAELNEIIPPSARAELQLLLDEKRSSGKKVELLTFRVNDVFIHLSLHDGEISRAYKFCTTHTESTFDFTFAEESDGTKRLFDFVEMLLTSDENCVFIVDEINRSLHPMLTRHLIELFAELHADDKVQLICTTHEDALLDTSLLRKDEIWFVDRAGGKGSQLYPLDQFAVRSDALIGKMYWEGRYGGIPFFAHSGLFAPDSDEGVDADAAD